MSTNNEFWYQSHNRGLETVAVWQTFASTFKVGELTQAQHAADVNLLYTHIEEQVVAQDAVDLARDSRDANGAVLTDVCTRALALIRGTLPAGDAMLDEVRGVNSVRGKSLQAMVSKCKKLVSLWLNVNALRAAMVPVQPALLVGTVDVTQFQSTLGNFSQSLQNVEFKLSELNRKKSQLRATAGKVDRNNKRWYQAWKGHFANGSPERDALSQITTTSATAPSLPGQGVILSVELLPNQTVRLSFGAARATEFTLWHKGPADTEFSVLADELTDTTFDHVAAEVGGHAYKVVGSNATGSGPESLTVVATVAQQLAA